MLERLTVSALPMSARRLVLRADRQDKIVFEKGERLASLAS